MKIQPIHTLISIALLLGVVYIAETNSLWVYSYILADEKKTLDDVKQAYTQLNTKIAQYNSIVNAMSNPEIIAMEKSDFIYLDQNGALVKK
jgi:uncharacterized protein YlxW (UPF0749 family)